MGVILTKHGHGNKKRGAEGIGWLSVAQMRRDDSPYCRRAWEQTAMLSTRASSITTEVAFMVGIGFGLDWLDDDVGERQAIAQILAHRPPGLVRNLEFPPTEQRKEAARTLPAGNKPACNTQTSRSWKREKRREGEDLGESEPSEKGPMIQVFCTTSKIFSTEGGQRSPRHKPKGKLFRFNQRIRLIQVSHDSQASKDFLWLP